LWRPSQLQYAHKTNIWFYFWL